MEPDLKALQEVLAQGRKKLGQAAYQQAYKKGKSMNLEEEIVRLLLA
jgi:hypothetical protein